LPLIGGVGPGEPEPEWTRARAVGHPDELSGRRVEELDLGSLALVIGAFASPEFQQTSAVARMFESE
jgi:hypothetical protein